MAKKYRSYTPYRMTARRKAALRKAQLASAKKRRRNRRIAAGVGILGLGALGATAAYAGYKNDKAANIAVGLKKRTPQAAKGSVNKIKSVFQPGKKEKTRMRSGLSKGWVSGAGPDAGQSKPNPRTTITDQDRQNAQNVRDRLNAENLKRQSMVFGEGPASRKDEWGDGRDTSLRGIPMAIRRGTKLSGRRLSSLIDKEQDKIAANGGEALSLEGRREIFGWHVSKGFARGRYYGKASPGWGPEGYNTKKKRTPKQRKAAANRKKRAQAKRQAANNKIRLDAFEQFLQDYE